LHDLVGEVEHCLKVNKVRLSTAVTTFIDWSCGRRTLGMTESRMCIAISKSHSMSSCSASSSPSENTFSCGSKNSKKEHSSS
jgi:hypothetical protein